MVKWKNHNRNSAPEPFSETHTKILKDTSINDREYLQQVADEMAQEFGEYMGGASEVVFWRWAITNPIWTATPTNENPQDLRSIPMRFAMPFKVDGCGDMEWNLPNNQCVPNYLKHTLSHIDGFKTKVTDAFMMKAFCHGLAPNGKPLNQAWDWQRTGDPFIDGINIYQLESWCNMAKHNMYALCFDELKVIHRVINNKHCHAKALMFRVTQRPFLPN